MLSSKSLRAAQQQQQHQHCSIACSQVIQHAQRQQQSSSQSQPTNQLSAAPVGAAAAAARCASPLFRRTAQHLTRPSSSSTNGAASLPTASDSTSLPPSNAALGEALKGRDSALLWFRRDLRTDDHPALQAVASATSLTRLACLYVIDPALLRPLLLRPAGPDVLVAALTALRSQLQALGGNLIIRTGESAAAVQTLVSELQAASPSSSGPLPLLTEAEPSHSTWSQQLHAAAEAAGTSAGHTEQPPPARLACWRSSAWAAEPFDINYRRWQAVRGAPSAPVASPSRLPPAPAGVAPGDIPSAEQLRQMLQQAAGVEQHVHVADTTSLEAQVLRRLASSSPDPLDLLSSYLTSRPSASASPEALQQSLARTLELSSPGEQGHRALLGEAAEALVSPAVPGGSFKLLLGPWMELGALSRRRVLQRAGAGASAGAAPLPDRAAAARRSAEVSDFHHLLAEHGAASNRPADAHAAVRIVQWTWRGMRNEFCVAEPPGGAAAGAPAILLVHGFGAFGDQWRGNVGALADAGFRVFAPTLPGFGRSEKNSVPYSQDLWRDFLRDFSVEVVGTKVVIVGNSIGGFIGASMAADYPHLVAGLVLLNSAGPIDPGFTAAAWGRACAAKSPPPRVVVELVSRALFWYLELSIAGTLKWLYPTNPDRADGWLGEEIYRAACDAGSLEVFQSVFYLPPPRALNYLVSELFQGPTLVLQGVLDPLNDARRRARDMKAACPAVEVVLLEAGHCPHDEQPEQVNQELLAFIQRSVLKAGVMELAVA